MSVCSGTLRPFKNPFSRDPRTLRADGVIRLYNNRIEDFVLTISQLHQNLESTQATLGSFQSPLCGARAIIVCNSRYGESCVVGCGYQISHSPTVKAHANQPSVARGKFTDPALQTAVWTVNDSVRPMMP
jgi:hypothetical protein